MAEEWDPNFEGPRTYLICEEAGILNPIPQDDYQMWGMAVVRLADAIRKGEVACQQVVATSKEELLEIMHGDQAIVNITDSD